MGTLPILDISDYLADPRSAAAEKTAIRLRDICHHQGFCYLIGHGMTARNNALATTAKQFFKLPRDERKSIALINAPRIFAAIRFWAMSKRAASKTGATS